MERQALRAECFRLILDEAASGVTNMATDEALLDSVSAGGLPVFRLYGFAPGALSVGRFQKSKGVIDFEALRRDGYDFVRRPSGGNAVLHDRELTYACVLGRHHLQHFSKREVYRFVVPLLLAGLRQIGVRDAAFIANPRGDPSDPDCFASSGEYEIDGEQGKKLVGSAQMVSRGAVLQHGSIPLSGEFRQIRTYLEPARVEQGYRASSLEEELGLRVSFEQARSQVARAISREFEVETVELTKDERHRRDDLAEQKYGNRAWNESR